MTPPVFPRNNALQRAAVALLTALVLLAAGCHRLPSNTKDARADVEIVLLTTNDLHGRLEPFTRQTGQRTQLTGGFAGLAAQMSLVEQKEHGAVLRLNSGDTLTGPYAVHYNGAALFGGLSRMGIDAATLGNHELDRGPEMLAQALQHCSFPMVVTNVDIPSGHVLEGALKPCYLFERAGKRLLVIGLLTPDVPHISSPGPGMNVLEPDGAEVRERIMAIIKEHRPDIVIALTHLGLEKDRLLARRIPGIDVICGGHSHDLLPAGEAATVTHADGRQTVIVQAGAGGIALGVLRIRLKPGRQPDYAWVPRNITASSAQSQQMLDFITGYRATLPPVQALTTTDTMIDCRAAILRSRETPIGNFIADSLREHFNTDVALYNGGGIRGDCILPAGVLTSMDVETMLPFNNEAVVISMPGAMLRDALEHSVAHLPQPWGGFLQVSGLRMRLDPQPQKLQHDPTEYSRTESPAQRITGVDIRGAGDAYHPLVPDRVYRIATNSFLARGGNGYFQFSEATAEAPTGAIVRDIIMHSLAEKPHRNFTTDGRISMTTSGE
jgi:2',3'-cyclic-nucleotide 2'-phosphodiesterase (5'-nucleotidase family)